MLRQAKICGKCEVSIYREYIENEGNNYHPQCYKCKTCGKIMKEAATVRGFDLYCANCTKNLKPLMDVKSDLTSASIGYSDLTNNLGLKKIQIISSSDLTIKEKKGYGATYARLKNGHYKDTKVDNKISLSNLALEEKSVISDSVEIPSKPEVSQVESLKQPEIENLGHSEVSQVQDVQSEVENLEHSEASQVEISQPEVEVLENSEVPQIECLQPEVENSITNEGENLEQSEVPQAESLQQPELESLEQSDSQESDELEHITDIPNLTVPVPKSEPVAEPTSTVPSKPIEEIDCTDCKKKIDSKYIVLKIREEDGEQVFHYGCFRCFECQGNVEDDQEFAVMDDHFYHVACIKN